jgi:hypothetical protein
MLQHRVWIPQDAILLEICRYWTNDGHEFLQLIDLFVTYVPTSNVWHKLLAHAANVLSELFLRMQYNDREGALSRNRFQKWKASAHHILQDARLTFQVGKAYAATIMSRFIMCNMYPEFDLYVFLLFENDAYLRWMHETEQDKQILEYAARDQKELYIWNLMDTPWMDSITLDIVTIIVQMGHITAVKRFVEKTQPDATRLSQLLRVAMDAEEGNVAMFLWSVLEPNVTQIERSLLLRSAQEHRMFQVWNAMKNSLKKKNELG